MTDPIVVKGSHFFHSQSGLQFLVKGTTYQDTGKRSTESTVFIDPLADGPTCARDIPYLVKLGINTISLLAVDPTIDHSNCMTQLQRAGIYVIARLTGQPRNVDQDLGEKPASWDYPLYQRFSSVVDEFQKYPNVLGFVVAENVEFSKLQITAYPFVKAAVRDIKAYIRHKNYRNIPVGYFGGDFGSNSISEYLNCATNRTSIDFFGTLRSVIWDMSANAGFGWNMANSMIRDYRNLSIPIIISNYLADDTIQSWPYSEVQTMYAANFTKVFSGAIQNGYFHNWDIKGLVDVDGNEVITRPNYASLQSQLAAVHPTYTQMSSYSPGNTAPPFCHSLTIRTFLNPEGTNVVEEHASVNLPPTPHSRLCKCMMQAISCTANYKMRAESNTTLLGLCNENNSWCLGVGANGSKGEYGAFSVCNATEQQSWVFDQFYKSQGQNASSCTSIAGSIQSVVPSDFQPRDCKAFLGQAGSMGTGTISVIPQPESTVYDDDDRYELGSGGKAGIGVGVVVFAALCFVLGFFFQSRLRKRRAASKEADESQKAELEGSPVTANSGSPYELAEKGEIQRTEMMAEADDDVTLTELPAANGRSSKITSIFELPGVDNEISILRGLRRGDGDKEINVKTASSSRRGSDDEIVSVGVSEKVRENVAELIRPHMSNALDEIGDEREPVSAIEYEGSHGDELKMEREPVSAIEEESDNLGGPMSAVDQENGSHTKAKRQNEEPEPVSAIEEDNGSHVEVKRENEEEEPVSAIDQENGTHLEAEGESETQPNHKQEKP